MPIIINAVIVHTKYHQCTLLAELDNGEFEDLFTYYPDELTFNASYFIGMTTKQATDYYHQQDIAYLRS